MINWYSIYNEKYTKINMNSNYKTTNLRNNIIKYAKVRQYEIT